MFETEKQLSSVIKHGLIKNPTILANPQKGSTTYVLEETDLGYGRADLVMSFCKKIYKRAQPLSLFDLNILNIIQKKGEINKKDIIELTRTNISKIDRALSKLEDEGLVSTFKDNVLFNNYENFQQETFAIEVKIKNWRRALEQAYRYRNFAFYSYVFMDKKYVTPAIKNKSLFQQYNIGLASVSNTGIINIIYKPLKSKPFDIRMNMLFNENIIHTFLSFKKVNQGSR